MKANDNHNSVVIETTLLRGKVKLLQPKVGFHASPDTVYLAAAVPVRNGWKYLDMGCGVGSAGLCVSSRNSSIYMAGIDIQKELVDLALQNATLNGVGDHFKFFCGDFKKDKTIQNNYFDCVLMNPPYQKIGTHTPSPKRIKAYAHGEDASGASFDDWVKYAHRKLKIGGYLTLIHRADRVDEAITALTRKRWFGSLVIQPLMPREGDDAKRVIIRCRKERYTPAIIKSGIVLHEADGTHTKAARAILEEGAAIEL